ncbi:hypothetical protein BEWA_032160 [Theileria equi strain WA]|uniref:RRM domain-containing protein n=1 Tax=Theileria equi strain WA TaxID=1537102 RepID=L0AYP1_THEEQ|nr:hypothetical protein BEWA_032160 [Theileria equi strain WA]AFZ80363.1 hypothetical protein BEWA_032160 [Theileria equi strain WA]|eukprot:XP_004830029.1 hypothetical protein BEWA_032160 [Theileria equi strain WA]
MSVTGPGANISAIQRLSELELQTGAIGESSWHNRYKDSCYIYIGGLDKRMTEGDIIIVFSQFGEPIDINLKRNGKTGESLGYCFLGYKDQRSTILAVDNFNGSTLLGRRIRVDHVLDYKAPVIYEDECDEDGNKIRKEYKPTGAEGSGIDKFYVTESEAMLKETVKKAPKEEPEMDEDEKWALEFERNLRNNRDYSQSRDSSHSIDRHLVANTDRTTDTKHIADMNIGNVLVIDIDRVVDGAVDLMIGTDHARDLGPMGGMVADATEDTRKKEEANGDATIDIDEDYEKKD